MSDEFDATLRRIDPQTARVDPHGSPGKLATGHGGGRIRRMGRRAAVRRGQPPRRHLDRGERLACPLPTRRWHTTGKQPGTCHRLRRSHRVAPVGRCGRAHARPRPGHQAAAPGRRRHDVHVHAPPGNPLLQRRGPCGRPTSAAASSASSSSGRADPDYYDGILGASACRQHPRRCDLSAGIVTDDATGTVTFHLAQADPDFLYKLALIFRCPGPARYSRPRHQPRAVPARHRPVHDLAIQAEQIRYPRAQSVLPAVVIRRPASGLPVRHPVRAHGQPERVRNRRSSPAGPTWRSFSPVTISLSRSGTRPGSTSASGWVPDMPLSTPACRRSRTSRPGKPSTTPSIAPGSSSSTTPPPARPPRRARCSRLTSPATRAIAPTRPAPGTGPGMARTWRRRCGWCRESGTTNVPVTVWSFNDVAGQGGRLLPRRAPR